MVHCGKEDFIVGFIIYSLIHPEHKIEPNNKPKECPNTNYFLDGGFADLYFQMVWGGSIHCQLGPNGEFSNPNDHSESAWLEICNNYEEVKLKAIEEFKKRFVQTMNSLKDDFSKKSQGHKALPMLERLIDLGNQAKIELPPIDVNIEELKQEILNERKQRRRRHASSSSSD